MTQVKNRTLDEVKAQIAKMPDLVFNAGFRTELRFDGPEPTDVDLQLMSVKIQRVRIIENFYDNSTIELVLLETVDGATRRDLDWISHNIESVIIDHTTFDRSGRIVHNFTRALRGYTLTVEGEWDIDSKNTLIWKATFTPEE